jgi:hypothetical protein
MSLDKISEWLDEYGQFDSSPWTEWFDKTYCKNCPDIMCKYEDGIGEFPCSYCELNGNCKFFPEYNKIPDNKTTIKMWLKSNYN